MEDKTGLYMFGGICLVTSIMLIANAVVDIVRIKTERDMELE